MSSTVAQLVESHREGAETYQGDAMCRRKCVELLEELHLPRGLLPLRDMEEVGYNRGTGFVWLKQKRSITHSFKKIGRQVWYDTEVSAFVEDRRMKKITGVKSKELLIWITLCDMMVPDPSSTSITFRTPAGLGRSYPVSAFELDREDDPAAAASK